MRTAGLTAAKRSPLERLTSPPVTRRAGKGVGERAASPEEVRTPVLKAARKMSGGVRVKGGFRPRRYPFPFVLPSSSLVTSWEICYRLRWAKRRAKNNYMKRFSRRGIPIPKLRPEWDRAIPDPPTSAGPKPVGGRAWYDLKEDLEADFSYCAVSPRAQAEFEAEM